MNNHGNTTCDAYESRQKAESLQISLVKRTLVLRLQVGSDCFGQSDASSQFSVFFIVTSSIIVGL